MDAFTVEVEVNCGFGDGFVAIVATDSQKNGLGEPLQRSVRKLSSQRLRTFRQSST
jgi:hypothetical protein